MPLYREQDVERRAWGKHGGPEAFDAYLDKLQQRHVKKHGPHKPFTQPAQYASRGGMVYIVGLKESQISCDRYVGKSPTLLRIKQKMPEWIWKACNEALEWQDLRNYESLALGGRGFFVRDQDREGPMERALELSRRYPERPKDPLVSSPSVDMLREVLTTAPAIPKGEAYDEIIHELVRYEDFAGDVSYRWSDAYVGRICSALFGVIQEHGTGDEGWRTARWEVYDKHTECLSGVAFAMDDDYGWVDGTWEWLLGQISLPSMKHYIRGRCTAGEQCNNALPVQVS